MLGQQKGSRLRASVKNESVVGKNAFVERIGSTAAVDAASRHDDTPRIDTPHSRRRLSLRTSRWADLIDNADKVKKTCLSIWKHLDETPLNSVKALTC